MTKVSLRPGLAYSFLYPRYNYAGLPRRLELRCVLVTDIRDTRIDRLNPQTKPLNPTLNRGRWLVTGQDLDRGAERSFYFNSMRSVQKIDTKWQPTEGASYVVVDRGRVAFSGRSIGEAIAFAFGAGRGVICRILRQSW